MPNPSLEQLQQNADDPAVRLFNQLNRQTEEARALGLAEEGVSPLDVPKLSCPGCFCDTEPLSEVGFCRRCMDRMRFYGLAVPAIDMMNAIRECASSALAAINSGKPDTLLTARRQVEEIARYTYRAIWLRALERLEAKERHQKEAEASPENIKRFVRSLYDKPLADAHKHAFERLAQTEDVLSDVDKLLSKALGTVSYLAREKTTKAGRKKASQNARKAIIAAKARYAALRKPSADSGHLGDVVSQTVECSAPADTTVSPKKIAALANKLSDREFEERTYPRGRVPGEALVHDVRGRVRLVSARRGLRLPKAAKGAQGRSLDIVKFDPATGREAVEAEPVAKAPAGKAKKGKAV